MKIAIPSTGKALSSPISQVFGRCPFYVIVQMTGDSETSETSIENTEFIENPAVNQRGGAGIKASQTLGNKGVEAVLATRIGPRAFDVLNKIGVKIYQAEEGTVQKNIDKFLKGELQEMEKPGQMNRGLKPRSGKNANRRSGRGQKQ
ncbi:MAG: NifB/NifX family molybdenum-iron cluster-binding protein [archaeon]